MKILLILLCAVLVLPVDTAYAAESDVTQMLSDTVSADSLTKAVPSEARRGVKNMSPSDSDLNTGLSNISKLASSVFGSSIKQSLKTFLLIAVCALLLGIAGSTGTAEKPLLLAGVLSIAMVCFSDVNSLFGLVTKTVSQMDEFSKLLLPALSAATIAAGSPVGATVRNTATVLFSDALITIINRFMIPCAYAYLALVTADAAIGNSTLKGFADFIKSALTGLLKLMLTLYVAYLAVSGVISGASDVMLEKSARLAISGMVPVVGGIVSDATQTLVAGAGILKNSIGVFGLIAVLGITVAPLIRLGINYLLFKLAAAVSAPTAPQSIMKYIDSVAQVYALMLAMTVSAAVILLIGIVSFMQAGMGG